MSFCAGERLLQWWEACDPFTRNRRKTGDAWQK